MRRGLWGLVWVLAACGGDAPLGPPGVTALYGPVAGAPLTPYPSNRLTEVAATPTGLRLALAESGARDLLLDPGLEETVRELDAMDGFSTSGGVVVSFDGPIDTRTLAPRDGETDPIRDASELARSDSPLILIDVDPASPDRGRAYGLVARWWEQEADAFWTTSDYTLVAQPAVPLRPQTRYLFVVTDALRARDGGPVHRAPATEALLAGDEGSYGDEVRAALGDLAAFGVAPDRIRLATTFTTASIHDEMAAVADLVRGLPPPALVEPFTVETPLAADGRVRFRAVFEAPELRQPLPDGRFVFSDGVPIVQETVGLEVYAAFSDAMTSEPRTVVIYGHGLGGDKDGSWGTAARLADLNAAVFAIDSPHHGSRGEGAATGIFRFFGIDTTDSSFVIGRARDNFRQMAADQLGLVRLIASLAELDVLPPGAPDGVPDLDTSRILYIGHSFGAVQGPTVLALAPEIRHAVLNVGGANLMMLLRDSGTFSILVDALKPPSTPDGALGRFFAVSQAIVDPGDPINYARYGALEAFPGVSGWLPRDILLQEVIGDTIVPNSTTRALARAAGLALVDPLEPVSGLDTAVAALSGNLDGATGALSQFDRVDGDTVATHGELIFSEEGRAQYVTFFLSALAGAAVVAPPY